MTEANAQPQQAGSILVDCDACPVRDLQCGDCVVTFLLSDQAPSTWLDPAEQLALGVLADSGLVPPLRLVAGS